MRGRVWASVGAWASGSTSPDDVWAYRVVLQHANGHTRRRGVRRPLACARVAPLTVKPLDTANSMRCIHGHQQATGKQGSDCNQGSLVDGCPRPGAAWSMSRHVHRLCGSGSADCLQSRVQTAEDRSTGVSAV